MIEQIDKLGLVVESIRLPCRVAGSAKPRLRGLFRFAQSHAVWTNIIRPLNLHNMNNLWDLHPTLTSYRNQIFYTTRVSAFSFYLKKKTPAKEKQTRGFTPRPRQRHAAAHSSRLSIGSSAHSPANAPELERVRARASCFASRSLAALNQLIKHCGASIEGLIIEVNRSLAFTLI